MVCFVVAPVGFEPTLQDPKNPCATITLQGNVMNFERVTGLEPVTFALARQRTTNCATPAYSRTVFTRSTN